MHNSTSSKNDPGCDEKMEQMKALEVRHTQQNRFDNRGRHSRRAPEAKAGCNLQLLQVPAPAMKKQFWASAAGDGELENARWGPLDRN